MEMSLKKDLISPKKLQLERFCFRIGAVDMENLSVKELKFVKIFFLRWNEIEK